MTRRVVKRLCTESYALIFGPRPYGPVLGCLVKERKSKEIDYRQILVLGEKNFRLQMQNRATRRVVFITEISVGISAENLSLQIQSLS